jgi:pyrophosphatase PpaX
MTPTLEAVLFDLDGTLLDSMELIRRSYWHALRVQLCVEPSHAEWLEGIGRPLRWQFARVARDAAEVEALLATYRAYNLAHHDASVRAFPGAVEAVRALAARGLRLGVVTSKLRHGAQRGLVRGGFDGLFDVVVSADDVREAKPHPEPVERALASLGIRAERAFMVGDSPHDLAAGKAAGTRTAAVAWGPFPETALRAVQPDVWLAEVAEIAGLA